MEPKELIEQDTVIISFGPFNGIEEIHKVDNLLFENIPEHIGRYDGHEVNMEDTDGTLYVYGKNAEELYLTIEPFLNQFQFLNNASVYLRFTENGKLKSDLEFNRNLN